MLNAIMLNVILLNVIMLNAIMLNVILLNVIMLNVIMMNVIMMNVLMLNCFLFLFYTAKAISDTGARAGIFEMTNGECKCCLSSTLFDSISTFRWHGPQYLKINC
jgi:hypothetical protein